MGLAVRDLVQGFGMTLCLTAAISAIIAPLLLLIGLRTGVVETMRNRILSDPSALEVSIRGNGALDQAWFDALNEREELAFAIPLTRSLNTEIDLVKTPREFVRFVELIPTAAGDPVLTRFGLQPPEQPDQIVLSKPAADALNVQIGDIVNGKVLRKREGEFEPAETPLTVIAIAPQEMTNKKQAFVRLVLLENVERYHDAETAPMFGDEGELAAKGKYARARIYARSLEQVQPLAEFVQSTNVESEYAAGDIQTLQSIERNSRRVLQVVIGTTLVGGIAALMGFVITKVERRRIELAVLRMLGFSSLGVASFPVVQAVAISLGGLALAFGLYFVGNNLFNLSLGFSLGEGESVSVLPGRIVLQAFLCVLGASILAAGLGGIYASRIDPSEPLRDH
nr:ABC transporter permease [uncultured Hyphomonas sp.]